MKRVSVVGTVHAEKGRANTSALLAILERIKPEVIFLEIPSAAFDDHFNGNSGNLESTAVSRYRENHRVDLIPVDLPTPDAGFFAKHQHLSKRIERTSPDYRRLVHWHSQNVSAHGFAYLNSKDCSDLFSQLHEAMLAAIAKDVDHRLLAEVYDLWIRTNELREKGMTKNIENHCRQASFRSAVFLVGAAHRQPIIDLSRSEPRAATSTIQWVFGRFLEEPSLEREGSPRRTPEPLHAHR